MFANKTTYLVAHLDPELVAVHSALMYIMRSVANVITLYDQKLQFHSWTNL